MGCLVACSVRDCLGCDARLTTIKVSAYLGLGFSALQPHVFDFVHGDLQRRVSSAVRRRQPRMYPYAWLVLLQLLSRRPLAALTHSRSVLVVPAQVQTSNTQPRDKTGILSNPHRKQS